MFNKSVCQRIGNGSLRFFLSVWLLYCLPALGQNNNTEEVIVISKLSLEEIKEQIVEVENDVFRLFNASNVAKGTPDLSIECRRETPTGTHFPIRVCEPVFLTKARLQNNRDYVANLERQFTPQQLQAHVAPLYDAMNTAYAELLEEDAVFAEVVGILGALQTRLAQLQSRP